MSDLKYLKKYKKFLNENLQLADKYYFKNNKLSNDVRNIILKITGGDAWTKLITDIYWAKLKSDDKLFDLILKDLDIGDEDTQKNTTKSDLLHISELKKIKSYHKQLKNYNKNVFPIKYLDPNGVSDDKIWSIIRALDQRENILDMMKDFPSIAKRNLKQEIRKERDGNEMNDWRHKLEYFSSSYSLLSNRDEELRKKLNKKIFKSGITLDKLIDFVDERSNLLGGIEFDKNKVKEIVENNEYSELEIIYEKDNIMVIEVSGETGIKEIGCNSLWCFTYSDNYSRDWHRYSYNDTVYVIIDFQEESDSPYFMNVLIKPITWEPTEEQQESGINDDVMFDMRNDENYEVLNFIDSTIGIEKGKELFTFGY